MSARGDLTRADLAQIDREFGIAANTPQPRRYWVRHIRGGIVEAQFEAVAADALACATDHPAPEGARCDVMGLDAWREKCAVEADLAINRKKNSDAWRQSRVDAAHSADLRDLEVRGVLR